MQSQSLSYHFWKSLPSKSDPFVRSDSFRSHLKATPEGVTTNVPYPSFVVTPSGVILKATPEGVTTNVPTDLRMNHLDATTFLDCKSGKMSAMA